MTFTETIAPIVYANCVTCHRPGEAAPFSLISYEDVAKRGALIATRDRVALHAAVARRHGLRRVRRRAAADRCADRDDCRMGEAGDAARRRAPRCRSCRSSRPTAGSSGSPTSCSRCRPASTCRATGPDVFRNFVIPTRLTEDKWVRAVEFRPGARKVVHHALFAYVPAAASRRSTAPTDVRASAGWARSGVHPATADVAAGLAAGPSARRRDSCRRASRRALPKGSDFLLQMHFHPTGKPETEKSLDRHLFRRRAARQEADVGDGARAVRLRRGHRHSGRATKDYTIKDSFTLPGDMKVYCAGAHAHYLARQMKAMATLPDGSTRSLLWIKDWDFNWQDGYIYKQPFTLPKGTRIDVTITYDNSADNPRNPISPPRRARVRRTVVRRDGAVLFDFEVVNKADMPAFEQALGQRMKEAIAVAGKNGTLGRFLARTNRERGGRQQLTVLDRSGAIVTRVAEPAFLQHAAMSPDGIAGRRVEEWTARPATEDIWIYDVATGRGRALTNDEPRDMTPVWSADGRSIAFISVRDNRYGVYRRAADGSGAEERLYEHNTGGTIFLTDWSADGRLLTFWANERMYVMPLTGDRTPAELPNARGGRFSPDGRLLAFSALAERARQVPRLRGATRFLVAGSAGGVAEGHAATGLDRQRDRRFVLAPRRTRAGVHVAAAEAIGHGGRRDEHGLRHRVGHTAGAVRAAARRRRSRRN